MSKIAKMRRRRRRRRGRGVARGDRDIVSIVQPLGCTAWGLPELSIIEPNMLAHLVFQSACRRNSTNIWRAILLAWALMASAAIAMELLDSTILAILAWLGCERNEIPLKTVVIALSGCSSLLFFRVLNRPRFQRLLRTEMIERGIPVCL